MCLPFFVSQSLEFLQRAGKFEPNKQYYFKMFVPDSQDNSVPGSSLRQEASSIISPCSPCSHPQPYRLLVFLIPSCQSFKQPPVPDLRTHSIQRIHLSSHFSALICPSPQNFQQESVLDVRSYYGPPPSLANLADNVATPENNMCDCPLSTLNLP